jgi:hypothetical protein
MSYSDSTHGQRHSNQPIPLQDLNRPPDDLDPNAPQHTHRRTLSDRGRNLLRNTGALASGHFRDTQYAPIADVSPSPTRHTPRPHIDTSLTPAQHGIRKVQDDDAGSPLDTGAFQAAIGFGMSMDFQGETSPPIPTPSSQMSYVPLDNDAYLPRSTSEDQGYFSPTYDDTTRLTDPHNLQPMSGAALPSTPIEQGRSSFQSVHFLSPGDASSGARHGDDISHVEAGAGNLRDSRGRSRSLSPGQFGSPLHRAGTIMRNMSQRVINVTNDSQVTERTIRRKSTVRHARLLEPPSFPALPEYATDGPTSPIASTPIEKPPSPIAYQRQPSWQRPPNPLRGKSLGIFPADSKLRMKLCDLLVHPVTEPLLLILIIIQTVLLAVDARTKAQYNPEERDKFATFGNIDFALLGLFVVYTLEIIVRVIVSGFIINPVEYSTINRQVGLREAVLTKADQIFSGFQRQPSQRKSGVTTNPAQDPHQPSVLRSFTTAQMYPPDDGPVDARQQQRIRLAHRAYLRHSFNRADFVAVTSYWIAFILGLWDINNSRVILVFEMLSCLRIIRLLNLTSGTSVS